MSGKSTEQGRIKHKGDDLHLDRDKTHMEQVVRWAEFVRTHPREVWIKQTEPLVDSQILMANRFYERLSRTDGGVDKIKELRGIKKKNH